MVKNNTASLSNKELDLIENLIFERGSLVTFDNIYQKLGKNKTKQERNKNKKDKKLNFLNHIFDFSASLKACSFAFLMISFSFRTKTS